MNMEENRREAMDDYKRRTKEQKQDGGGVLDFDEVITLFYMFNNEKYGQNLRPPFDQGMIKEPLQVLKEVINVWNVGATVVIEIGEMVVNEIREESGCPIM
ncbi:hypothetical protein NL676_019197 [Syzygium grande]|nr:hypothetical protein NL676_019197 [Syzygium grande]